MSDEQKLELMQQVEKPQESRFMLSDQAQYLLNLTQQLELFSKQNNQQFQVKLPKIVVVGLTSSGKSSLLTALIQLNVFPRNTGVCTRQPIELNIRQTELDEQKVWISCEGEDGSSKPLEIKKDNSNLVQIEKEIQNFILKRQDQLAKEERFSNKKICVTFESRNLGNLTVVDLPGLIANGNGKEQVYNMVSKIINDLNVIILLVHQSQLDMSGDLAYALVKEIDPDFKRVIGVLTKIDQEDNRKQSIEFAALLNEKQYQDPRYGWFLTVCRLQNKKEESFEEFINNEQTFFDQKFKKEIQEIVKNKKKEVNVEQRCGIKKLKESLEEILIYEIKRQLPEAIALINFWIEENKKAIRILDKKFLLGKNQSQIKEKINILIFEYAKKLQQVFKSEIFDANAPKGESYLAQQILVFSQQIRQESQKELDIDSIKNMHKNTTTLRNIYPSNHPFELTVEKITSKFLKPCQDFRKEIFSHLKGLIGTELNTFWEQYHNHYLKIEEESLRILKECKKQCKALISESIARAQQSIGSNHAYFKLLKQGNISYYSQQEDSAESDQENFTKDKTQNLQQVNFDQSAPNKKQQKDIYNNIDSQAQWTEKQIQNYIDFYTEHLCQDVFFFVHNTLFVQFIRNLHLQLNSVEFKEDLYNFSLCSEQIKQEIEKLEKRRSLLENINKLIQKAKLPPEIIKESEKKFESLKNKIDNEVEDHSQNL